jgi:hypothetical protein
VSVRGSARREAQQGLTLPSRQLVEWLPCTESVSCGDPAQFASAFRALHEWVDQTGARATPFERELYIDCEGPRDTWVSEL